MIAKDYLNLIAGKLFVEMHLISPFFGRYWHPGGVQFSSLNDR